MNQFRLQSSSLTIVRNTTNGDNANNNVVNRLINIAVRLLTFKNALILSLFCFLLVSAVFQLDSSSSSSSRRYFTYIVARTNGSLRVREIRRSSHLSLNISTHNNFTSIDSSYQEGAEIATDMFEEEANAIKDSIRNAFLSVNKKIDYCPLFLDTLKGLLNITEILEQIHLNGLVQFHDKNSFNLSSNKYNENELTYLDERKLEANKNNVRFREFWDIWHSNDLNRLNETVEGVDSDLEFGGRWRPPNCQSRYRVAIIIPYRDRLPHLMVLVKYLHVFLKRQMIDYQIFVVEPTTPLSIKFNKGRVMNSAYLEALKIDPSFNCVIFHDVDLIPEDDRNMYTCSTRPKHLSVGIDKFNYRLPYDYLVGGVFSIKTVQYREINGYSNSYWGWGGEDDDFAARIKHSKLTVNRPPTKIARYKMMRHKLQKLNEERHRLLRKTYINHRSDGLNSVKYNVIQKRIFNGFTYFLVDIGNP